MLKRILVLDFDGTVTMSDTTSIIGESVYKLKEVSVAWSHYTNVYERCHIPKPKSFDSNVWDMICEYERESRKCELNSITELEAQSHFKDVIIDDLLQLVKQKIQIRSGLDDLIHRFDDTYILSLNWSKELIHEVTGIPKAKIYCNELLSRDGVRCLLYTSRCV